MIDRCPTCGSGPPNDLRRDRARERAWYWAAGALDASPRGTVAWVELDEDAGGAFIVFVETPGGVHGFVWSASQADFGDAPEVRS